MHSMSSPQKLTMETIIPTRISNNDTSFPPLEEAQSLLGDRNQRENASRELMLPINMDIAKIISSADSDSEESNEEEEDETPEALPEVSWNVQIKNNKFMRRTFTHKWSIVPRLFFYHRRTNGRKSSLTCPLIINFKRFISLVNYNIHVCFFPWQKREFLMRRDACKYWILHTKPVINIPDLRTRFLN